MAPRWCPPWPGRRPACWASEGQAPHRGSRQGLPFTDLDILGSAHHRSDGWPCGVRGTHGPLLEAELPAEPCWGQELSGRCRTFLRGCLEQHSPIWAPPGPGVPSGPIVVSLERSPHGNPTRSRLGPFLPQVDQGPQEEGRETCSPRCCGHWGSAPEAFPHCAIPKWTWLRGEAHRDARHRAPLPYAGGLGGSSPTPLRDVLPWLAQQDTPSSAQPRPPLRAHTDTLLAEPPWVTPPSPCQARTGVF